MALAKSRNIRVFLKNLVVFPKGLWLARIAKREGVEHFHAHFASTNATAALVASFLSGIPWSFSAHRWDISENNLLEKKAEVALFARVIDARGSQELKTYLGRHKQKVRIIHMGVAILHPSHRKAGTPRGSLRVLMAARFDELKGHRYALDAIARLKSAGVDVALDCAGHGPLKAKIEKYAAALDVLDRVQFPGLLDHHELLTQLGEHRWDVALLPSLETREDREGIPVFLIEAMAAGVPVVGTNTGGIPELLENGAGILVPQQDAIAIAEALARLAADGDLRFRLAEAGIRRVRDQFTIESTVSALLDEIFSRRQLRTTMSETRGTQ